MITEGGPHGKLEKSHLGPTLLVESLLPGTAVAATTPKAV